MEEEKNKESKPEVLVKTKSEVERIIKQLTDDGLQATNVDLLYKLIDIHKDIENEEYWKEKEEYMMYRGRDSYMDGSYNGGRSRDSRGRYMDGSYGRRGRYRGYDMLDEMGEHYGEYSEGRDTYGNDRETEKSFERMLKCFEGFAMTIMDEADDPEKIDKIRKTARKISEM